MARIVIIGAGIAGLGAAIRLADQGHAVTIVEQDGPPPTTDGDAAFNEWDRRNVPQFRHAHGFSARSRNLLLEYAPGVLDRLAADGIEDANAFKMLAPPELHRPDDELFTGVMSRRPAFELALRLEAASRAGITFECPAAATGLVVADATAPPRVAGIRLADGRDLVGDLVLDAGGRRSPVVRWLAAIGVDVHEDVQDCEITYHTRYFRRHPDSLLPLPAIFAIRTDIEHLLVLGFTGDHDTYGIVMTAAAWDDDLRELRHDWAWTAVAESLPAVAPWVAPENGTPLGPIATMTGHRNVRRSFIHDGEPVVLGLLAIGDALCTTNPAYGWGASMALTYAFAACDAIAAGTDDLSRLARRYDGAIAAEADGVYEESAANDRVRGYQWRGTAVPEADRDEEERQSLITDGIMAGMLRDAVLGRAFLRRANLLEPPRALFDDPEVMEHAAAIREKTRARSARIPVPTREDVRAVIAAARR